ncbi:hypothetical protein GFC01_05870 [Desulfofundulus thermobenzoicus]|uniref:CpXC domain-containing protein n=1 Tax=Desulfofundulus thermobenzoicus TaxID=29376 RepID=A0A6N7IP46_9FIRM|nr:hypothetical protein [Desulfofundulus thermobenzoicus]MQL51796.1 hypothetical protein [Desulfofundulus thermobenzoicus]
MGWKQMVFLVGKLRFSQMAEVSFLSIFDVIRKHALAEEKWAFDVLYCPRKRDCGYWVDVAELSQEQQSRIRQLYYGQSTRVMCPQCREKVMRYYQTTVIIHRFEGFILTFLHRVQLPDYSMVYDHHWENCLQKRKPFLLLQANGRLFSVEYDLATVRRPDGFLPAVSEKQWYREVYLPFAAKYDRYKAFSPVRGTLFCAPDKAYEAARAVLAFWKRGAEK